MGDKLTETFMLLFCEKNSDGTKNLVLKGKDMWQRIGTRIKPRDMCALSQFLLLHPEVIGLDLCYNRICDKGLITLVDVYLKHENRATLKDLNLMYCEITEKGIEYLSKCKLKLRSLRLNGNKFGNKGGELIALLAAETASLWHLDVGESDQTLSSIPYFLKILNKNYYESTLRVLDLSRVIPLFNRYPYNSAHFAESLGYMLQFNDSLIELHLQKNQFDGHDIEIMMVGIRKNKSLLMLDFGYNRIADFGFEKICCWLNTRPQLLGLNVAGNGITDIGARYLSFTMPYSRIRLLDIGYNKITPIGIMDILNSIKKPYLMRMINIWGNKLNHESNVIIKRMIESKVLRQKQFDVKIYEVDEVLYPAFYPSDRFKHKYYCVMDYGCPVPIKIKRNYLPNFLDQPRRLVDLKYYPRLPRMKTPFGNPMFQTNETDDTDKLICYRPNCECALLFTKF